MSDTNVPDAEVQFDTSGRPVYEKGHRTVGTALNLISYANRFDSVVTPTELAIAIAVMAGDSYKEFSDSIYGWSQAAKTLDKEALRILNTTAQSLVKAVRGTHEDVALNEAYRQYLAAWLLTEEGKANEGSVNSMAKGKGRASSALAFLAGGPVGAAPKSTTSPFARERAARQAAEAERDAALAASGIDLAALRGQIDK